MRLKTEFTEKHVSCFGIQAVCTRLIVPEGSPNYLKCFKALLLIYDHQALIYCSPKAERIRDLSFNYLRQEAYVFALVHFSFCVLVSRIMQKLPKRFPHNLLEGWDRGQEGTHSISARIGTKSQNFQEIIHGIWWKNKSGIFRELISMYNLVLLDWIVLRFYCYNILLCSLNGQR